MGRSEDPEKAFRECLQKASPMSTAEAFARFHVARVLAEQGKKREATEPLKDALAGPLPAKDRVEADALLRKLKSP